MDEIKKHLVEPKCNQKLEASEAAEYRIYDVKMILHLFKNAGRADSIPMLHKVLCTIYLAKISTTELCPMINFFD